VNWRIPEDLRREEAGLGSASPYARQKYMSNVEYISWMIYFGCHKQYIRREDAL
jgi:hypothetical protein